jgi:large subunit ribosomal protein L10
MPSLKKQHTVDYLVKKIESANGFFLAEYHGLNVAIMSSLRLILRNLFSECIVVKNTLINLALNRIGIEMSKEYLKGSTVIILENNADVIVPLKAIVNFTKNNPKFKLKVGFVENKLIDISEIKQLSLIQSKELLVYNMLNNMKMPIYSLYNSFTMEIRIFLNVLIVIKSKKMIDM